MSGKLTFSMKETRFTLDDLNQLLATGVDMQDVIKVLLALKDMDALIPETDSHRFALEIHEEHGWKQETNHTHRPMWFDSFEDADFVRSQRERAGDRVRIIRQRLSAIDVLSSAELIVLRLNGAD